MKKIELARPMDSSRRDFLRISAAVTIVMGATAALPAQTTTSSTTMVGVPFEAKNPRIAIVGVGGRGTSLLKNLIGTDAEIVAICDIYEEKAKHAQSLVEAAGRKKPDIYFGNEHSFENLMKRNDIDLVIVATYWHWHGPIGVAAMESGKHAALEVPAVNTMEDCWNIVNTSEKTRRHCLILENCCYGYNETLILRLTHAGELGDLLYGEGAYLHDLRSVLFSNEGEGLWRRAVHTKFNGNLYPTHGIGPIANYLSIQRGDRFESMVSMSSKERGLDEYRKETVKPTDPRMAERYVAGDMNVSMVKTTTGKLITLKHDVVNPRPYSRVNVISGTKGVFEDYPARIYVDGQTGGEKYGSLDV